jgi:3-oxoacyl-[acyl-carrier protein] reductase
VEFNNKVVIITGAAGEVGKKTAEFFAKEGAKLALVDINEKKIEILVKNLVQQGCKATGFCIDVSQQQQVKDTVKSVMEKFGKIDVLINLAAICKMIPILDIDVAEWDHFMAVNLRSVFLFSQEVFRHMKEKKHGKIINIGSAAGKIGGVAAGAHYSASKAAVMCFTKSLALQAAPYKINVNAVCPGPLKGEMTDSWGEATNTEFANKIPFKEYGKSEDIAEAILFLASERSKYITGEILDVNGGLIMD